MDSKFGEQDDQPEVELGKILTVELALPGTPTYGLYCCLFNVLLDAEPKLPQTAVPPLFQALRPLVPRVREDGELLHRAEKMLFSGVRVDAEDCRVMRSTLLMTIARTLSVDELQVCIPP